jgi:HEAT repeat protein
VAIKASSSTLIESLIADLGAARVSAREAATARLTVIGPRAVERLIAFVRSGAPPAARVGGLRALEAIGDPRALDPALDILSDAGAAAAVGAAAAGVARVFLRGPRGAIAVDRLTVAALDRGRPEAVRLAALRALGELGAATIAPVLASLADDPSATIRAEATPRKRSARAADPLMVITRAADQRLPEDPGDAAALRRALNDAGASVPLQQLLRLIERIREREDIEPAARRDEWTTTRAAAHVALASRGSRLALYDLRESLASTKAPLPVEFLAALSMVGDVSCLEPIAGAHAKAKNAWWRDHLADAFRAIVTREKVTRRHAAVKKIAQRSPQTLQELWAGGSAARGVSGGPGGPGRAGGAGG